MKAIAWITLQILHILNRTIGYEKPTEHGVAMRPFMRSLWSWWNGQSVIDGKSMRYHLYHKKAIENWGRDSQDAG